MLVSMITVRSQDLVSDGSCFSDGSRLERVKCDSVLRTRLLKSPLTPWFEIGSVEGSS